MNVAGYKISDPDLVLPTPRDLHIPTLAPSPDPLMLTGVYETVLRSLRSPGGNPTADRVRVAVEWWAKAWPNTQAVQWPERLVYLKTAFEALTGTSTNWKSARKLRKTFEALPHTGSRSWTSPSRARKIEKARQNDRAAEEEGSGETQEVRSRGFLAESARGCEGSFEGPRRGRGDDADRFAD